MASRMLRYGVKGKLWYATEHRRSLPPFDERLLDEKDEEKEEVLTWSEVLHRLRTHQLLVLRMGGMNSNYFDSTDHHGHNHRVSALERAIRINVSMRSVYLGWRLPPPILQRLLHAITYDEGGIPLHQLRNLHIEVLSQQPMTILPDTLLIDLFQRQQKLRSIHLQSLPVVARPSSATAVAKKARRPMPLTTSFPTESVVTRCIIQQYHRLDALSSLALVDCHVSGDLATELAQFLHIRGGLADLSLRSNRTLSGPGLRLLCQAPIARRLDLSLCDFDPADVVAIAEGIAARSWPLPQLSVAGNYRMAAIGVRALLQPAVCEKLGALDISYCGRTVEPFEAAFRCLEMLPPQHSLLRRLILRGSAVSVDTLVGAVCRLLQSECALRHLDLTDPQDPQPWSRKHLRQLADAMQYNYDMEDLGIEVDTFLPIAIKDDDSIKTYKDISFYVRLNQAGRRILRGSNRTLTCVPTCLRDPWRCIRTFEEDWFDILEKAGKGEKLDVLYWMVRYCGENHVSTDHHYPVVGE